MMSKKYNLLLIQSPLRKGMITGLPVVYPLGLSYLAAALNKHNVLLFDPNLHKDHLFKLKVLIAEFKPDIIGIGLRVVVPFLRKGTFFADTRAYLKYIKSLSPHSLICIGGGGFSLFAKKNMEEMQDADFGIFLDGEESLPELLDNLDRPEAVKGIYFRRNGAVIFSGERSRSDFGNSLLPRKALLDIRAYDNYPFALGVRTKIGCAFHCAYCSYVFINGDVLCLRHKQDVVDEVEELIKKGAKSLFFVDNIFNFPQAHAESICEEIIKRKLDIKWAACFHLKYIDKDFLSLVKEAGCVEASFSPDGFSEETLKILEKEITLNDIVKAYDICNELGLRPYYGFLINIPNETLRDLCGLLWLILRLKKAKIEWNILFAVPNTKLYNMIAEIDKGNHPGKYLGENIYWKKLLVYRIIFKVLGIILILRRFVPKKICDMIKV